MSQLLLIAAELRDFIYNHPNTPEDTGNLKKRGVLESNPTQYGVNQVGVRVGGETRAPYVGFLEEGTRLSTRHRGWLSNEVREFANIIAQRYGGRVE